MVVDTPIESSSLLILGSKRYDETKGKRMNESLDYAYAGWNRSQKSGGGANADVRSISRWTRAWADGLGCLAGFREKKKFCVRKK